MNVVLAREHVVDDLEQEREIAESLKVRFNHAGRQHQSN
jgi:hypothetical protein